MSDNITIKKLLDLDETIFTKMSDITLEATITLALKPKNVKGSKDNRKWDFWSQFGVINDGTADIGCDLKTDKAENAFTKGMKIKVEKAETDIYKDKNGKTQRKLTKGKVVALTKKAAEPAKNNNGYETLSDGRTVVSREVWEKKDNRISRLSLAMKYIEAGKTFKQAEKDANNWVNWIYQLDEKPKDEPKPEKKPEENVIEKVGLEGVIDKDFDRDKLIQRLGKRFAELFVSGKTKGLGLEEWLTKNYKVKSFMALSDDYLVELDSVFDDMFEELQKELGG